ncbi:MAG TPA: zinc-binding alcohol dehydrogenase family protein [Rhodoblastus sp.]|nr:zinc-binding alcohol dehydrogenase family protein [Rhodoblastus sp.]
MIGGNGAVGRAALALGKALGARTLAALRKPEQAERLAAEGHETILLGAPDHLAAQVAAKLGGGADAIFDTTGAWLPASVPAAALHGALCVIAPPAMGQPKVEFPVLDFYRRGLTLIGINSLLRDTIACAGMFNEIAGLYATGALAPPPAPEQRPLSNGLEAYADVDMGYPHKIVLTPG